MVDIRKAAFIKGAGLDDGTPEVNQQHMSGDSP
jgi:hypothetical protein